MSKKIKETTVYGFGDFQLNTASERLTKHGEPVAIEPQLYALLWLFVQHPGVTVSKQVVEQSVWAGRPVSDDAVRAAIKKLRDVLQDDARAPQFIKTIPKQGFKWLAGVEAQNKPSGKPRQNKLISQWVIGVLAFTLFALGGWYVFLLPPQSKNKPNNVNITRLTSLTGSEVDANYNATSNLLAVIHRDSRGSPQQLYLKSLDDNVVTRLSWDNANYHDSYWSHDGKKLVFMRLHEHRENWYIAHINNVHNVTQLDTITSPLLDKKYVIGWTINDDGLLLAEEMQPGKQQRIYQFNITSATLTALTNPNVAGRGDYAASLSPDGSKLAILREEVAREATLLVTSMDNGNLLAKVSLSFVPSRLVWTPNGSTIAMSSFYGDHLRYTLSDGATSSTPRLPENSLDFFASCGETCYIMRHHNGNFLDLQETPLAAIHNVTAAPASTPLIGSGRLIRLNHAQDFPQYLPEQQGVVFVSLQGKQLFFQQLTKHNRVRNIATLDSQLRLNAVVVSPDGSLVAGSATGRLFMSTLNRDETLPVTFLTGALERYENPVWNHNSEQLYVSKLTANQPDIVTFDIASKQEKPVTSNLLAFSPVPDSANFAIGITPNLQVVTLNYSNGKWQRQAEIGRVTSASPNRWHLTSDALYYTKYQIPEAFLCKLSLEQMKAEHQPEQCWSVGNNRFRLHFDISSIEEKVMLVESLSAQSDIIQLSW
ncbi:hypothetical protein AVL56_09395 [Alteromonas stellipolaris]|nr:winged helix-turn-helix domain-containing protein [Alteromonas stellipolaris]AMJ94491.1 hypothetical protein AVL56_09395 [Alteromonas stellipolaris]